MVDASMSWTMALVERPSTPGYFFWGVSKVSKVHPQFSEPQAHEVAYPNFIVFLVKSQYALVFHKTILIKHRIIIEFPQTVCQFSIVFLLKSCSIPMAWKPPYDGHARTTSFLPGCSFQWSEPWLQWFPIHGDWFDWICALWKMM